MKGEWQGGIKFQLILVSALLLVSANADVGATSDGPPAFPEEPLLQMLDAGHLMTWKMEATSHAAGIVIRSMYCRVETDRSCDLLPEATTEPLREWASREDGWDRVLGSLALYELSHRLFQQGEFERALVAAEQSLALKLTPYNDLAALTHWQQALVTPSALLRQPKLQVADVLVLKASCAYRLGQRHGSMEHLVQALEAVHISAAVMNVSQHSSAEVVTHMATLSTSISTVMAGVMSNMGVDKASQLLGHYGIPCLACSSREDLLMELIEHLALPVALATSGRGRVSVVEPAFHAPTYQQGSDEQAPQFMQRLFSQLLGMVRLRDLHHLNIPCRHVSAEGACLSYVPTWVHTMGLYEPWGLTDSVRVSRSGEVDSAHPDRVPSTTSPPTLADRTSAYTPHLLTQLRGLRLLTQGRPKKGSSVPSVAAPSPPMPPPPPVPLLPLSTPQPPHLDSEVHREFAARRGRLPRVQMRFSHEHLAPLLNPSLAGSPAVKALIKALTSLVNLTSWASALFMSSELLPPALASGASADAASCARLPPPVTEPSRCLPTRRDLGGLRCARVLELLGVNPIPLPDPPAPGPTTSLLPALKPLRQPVPPAPVPTLDFGFPRQRRRLQSPPAPYLSAPPSPAPYPQPPAHRPHPTPPSTPDSISAPASSPAASEPQSPDSSTVIAGSQARYTSDLLLQELVRRHGGSLNSAPQDDPRIVATLACAGLGAFVAAIGLKNRRRLARSPSGGASSGTSVAHTRRASALALRDAMAGGAGVSLAKLEAAIDAGQAAQVEAHLLRAARALAVQRRKRGDRTGSAARTGRDLSRSQSGGGGKAGSIQPAAASAGVCSGGGGKGAPPDLDVELDDGKSDAGSEGEDHFELPSPSNTSWLSSVLSVRFSWRSGHHASSHAPPDVDPPSSPPPGPQYPPAFGAHDSTSSEDFAAAQPHLQAAHDPLPNTAAAISLHVGRVCMVDTATSPRVTSASPLPPFAHGGSPLALSPRATAAAPASPTPSPAPSPRGAAAVVAVAPSPSGKAERRAACRAAASCGTSRENSGGGVGPAMVAPDAVFLLSLDSSLAAVTADSTPHLLSPRAVPPPPVASPTVRAPPLSFDQRPTDLQSARAPAAPAAHAPPTTAGSVTAPTLGMQRAAQSDAPPSSGATSAQALPSVPKPPAPATAGASALLHTPLGTFGPLGHLILRRDAAAIPPVSAPPAATVPVAHTPLAAAPGAVVRPHTPAPVPASAPALAPLSLAASLTSRLSFDGAAGAAAAVAAAVFGLPRSILPPPPPAATTPTPAPATSTPASAPTTPVPTFPAVAAVRVTPTSGPTPPSTASNSPAPTTPVSSIITRPSPPAPPLTPPPTVASPSPPPMAVSPGALAYPSLFGGASLWSPHGADVADSTPGAWSARIHGLVNGGARPPAAAGVVLLHVASPVVSHRLMETALEGGSDRSLASANSLNLGDVEWAQEIMRTVVD